MGLPSIKAAGLLAMAAALSNVVTIATDDGCTDPAGARPVKPRGERTNRNAPCPCGSGKKFKFCCLKS